MKCSALTALMLLSGLCGAQDAAFDPNPEHPWNRLQRELYTRTTPDGKPHFGDGVDAQMVSRQRFYVDDTSSHGAVIEALDEFLKAKADELIRDPRKRALLQRDLWSVFTATVSPSPKRHPQPRELHERLVEVMRRVALSPEEIDALPDNLSQAARGGAYPRTYDVDHPDRAFLPVDLMQRDGSWVLVENRLHDDRLAAPIHVKEVDGRAVFLMFLRLPGGREATENYLRKLEGLLTGGGEPHQFPVGTQVALLRQMMLIDNAGRLRLSPLTESLQVRVYQRLEAPDFYEFTMSREDLLAGRPGGLRPNRPAFVSNLDLASAGIGSTRVQPDPSENDERHAPETPSVVRSCVVCHAGPGIYGFQSVFAHPGPSPLGPTSLEDQASSALAQTYQTDAWWLLSDIWLEHQGERDGRQ